MRSLRRLAFLPLLGALLLSAASTTACTEASASILPGGLTLAAAGDSIKVTVTAHTAATPDSAVVLVTARNAATLRLAAVLPAARVTMGPGVLLPQPVLAEGDTATVTACLTLFKRGLVVPVTPCATRLYTRPVLPPSGGIDSVTVAHLDSITIHPAVVAVHWLTPTSALTCAYDRLGGGALAPVPTNDPSCGLTPAGAVNLRRSVPARMLLRVASARRLGLPVPLPIEPDPWVAYRAAAGEAL